CLGITASPACENIDPSHASHVQRFLAFKYEILYSLTLFFEAADVLACFSLVRGRGGRRGRGEGGEGRDGSYQLSACGWIPFADARYEVREYWELIEDLVFETEEKRNL